MDCVEAAELLFEFLDEELEEVCCLELEEHLHICEHCSCHFEFEKSIIISIRRQDSHERASVRLKKRIIKIIEDI